MTESVVFTSTVTLPDGRHLEATVSIPADHPALMHKYAGEHTEYAQIATAQMFRNIKAGDRSRETEMPF